MVLLLGISTSWAFPQAVQEDKKDRIKPVPVITGYSGFVTTFEPGKQTAVPIFTPILLVPFGQRWLFEAEFEMEGEFERDHWNRT